MHCLRCKSHRVMHFIDGFGEKRVYCRTCSGSFPEKNFKLMDDQKSLITFTHEMHERLGFHN